MKFLTPICIFSFFIFFAYAYESSELRCVVCRAVAQELQNDVLKENSSKTVDVGGYQMDGKGNINKKKKLLVQSEMFLSELMDSVCDKMGNYVRATDKITGKLVLVNLGDMTAKPSLSEVDIIQDGDLNRSLEFLCKGIVEEFEEDVYEVYGGSSKKPVDDLCIRSTDLCPAEDNDNDDDDDDEFYEEKEEL